MKTRSVTQITRAAGARALALSLVLALSLGIPGGAPLSPPKPTPPLSITEAIKRWADGPVRYLMTYQEDEAVRSLKTVPELARFITTFWMRRDPSPGTFENEYRRTYWSRVIEANRRFRDSSTPGWKTDRGKVFILLGEPDEIVRDEAPATRGAVGAPTKDQIDDPDRRGLERWTYRHSQSRVGRGTTFIVGFVRDESMEYKLTKDASLLQPEFPGASTGDPSDASFGGIENGIGRQATASAGPTAAQAPISATPLPILPQLDTSILANYDLGNEMAAVPSNAETVIATVSAREFLEAFKATPRFEFFRAQDGSTFVNLGVLFQRKELYGDLAAGVSNLRVYASVTSVTDAKFVRYASNETAPGREDLSEPPSPGGFVEAWTGVALPPGRYRATLAVEDSLTGRLGRTAGEFEVPDFTGAGLMLSTVVFASEISDSDGRLVVKTARSSATFMRSESFGIYFEVYGLKDGPSPFDVAYQFYRDAGGVSVKLGKPIVFEGRTQAAQGWSVPLEKWPAGRYRVEVTVSTPSGESASTLGPFEVIESAAPAPASPGKGEGPAPEGPKPEGP